MFKRLLNWLGFGKDSHKGQFVGMKKSEVGNVGLKADHRPVPTKTPKKKKSVASAGRTLSSQVPKKKRQSIPLAKKSKKSRGIGHGDALLAEALDEISDVIEDDYDRGTPVTFDTTPEPEPVRSSYGGGSYDSGGSDYDSGGFGDD